MADASQTVRKQTLYISIAVSLLIGFVSGTILGGKSDPISNPTAAPQQVDDKAQAIAGLQSAIAQNPDSAEAWARLGNAYFDSDQYAKAIVAYNKSLEITPGDPRIMTDLGVMYRRNGQPPQALETFDKVLRINPRFEQALFNKGVVLFYDIKNYEEAFNSWRTLIQVNPNATTPSGSRVSDLIPQLQNQVTQNKQ